MPSVSRVPRFVAPQVPTLSKEPPTGDGWIHEIKHDGFRTVLRIDEGKLIAYHGRGERRRGELRFAGTAFLTLSGEARERLDRIDRLPSCKPPADIPKVRRPEWVKPEILVRVRHLQGGDTLRHASVQGLALGRNQALARGPR